MDDRLSFFRNRKLSKDERDRLITEVFPSRAELALSGQEATEAAWLGLFETERGEAVFARLMRDVLKVDQTIPGKSGPRPPLEYNRGMESLRQILGKDFSTLAFPDAFRMLIGTMSTRTVARKTNYSHMTISRLLRGALEPDVTMMEAIARAFGKQPSYFMEYRVVYILAHAERMLEDAPESTIDYFRNLTRRRA